MDDLEKSELMSIDEIHRYELPVSYKKLCELFDDYENESTDENIQELSSNLNELEQEVERLEETIELLEKKIEELEGR